MRSIISLVVVLAVSAFACDASAGPVLRLAGKGLKVVKVVKLPFRAVKAVLPPYRR